MNPNESKNTTHTGLFIAIFVLIAIGVAFFVFRVDTTTYQKNVPAEPQKQSENIVDESATFEILPEVLDEPVFTVTHIAPPDVVKAVYMSSWVAATPSLRNKIIAMIDRTEINAIVLDIKDSTGKISFTVTDPELSKYGSSENRIKNIKEFIEELHQKNIYVIGRISVFQDPYLAVKYPHLAVKKKSDGGVWKDHKGLSFLDPNNKEVWDYTVALAKESYAVGFDEINFDYIRFPSDGDISDINYGLGEGETRAGSIEKFFAHLRAELVNDELQIPMSADLFGMVTSVSDDLGIGQVLEKALPYFDYIAPMVYPSHYPKNWNGYADPASRPYDVIYTAMASGITRVEKAGYDKAVFRPWIQDFNLGATYTPAMVQDQIRALQELGIHSWLVWDPANTYTESAFAMQDSVVE